MGKRKKKLKDLKKRTFGKGYLLLYGRGKGKTARPIDLMKGGRGNKQEEQPALTGRTFRTQGMNKIIGKGGTMLRGVLRNCKGEKKKKKGFGGGWGQFETFRRQASRH